LTELRTTRTLAHAAATRIVREAVAAATADGAPVTVAVVDASGTLLAFEKMDGTGAFSARFAIAKAVTSVTFGRPSGDMESLFDGRPGFTAGFVNKGDWLISRGGAPVIVDGETVGAVGISGNSAEVEDALARRLAAAG
jgi:glc operon protein GlcG